jgi:hypothetical protein
MVTAPTPVEHRHETEVMQQHDHQHGHRRLEGSSWPAVVARVVVLLLGLVVVRIASGDEMLQYVKPSMRVPLLLCGGFVSIVAGLQLFRGPRRVHVPLSAAWLLLPVVLIGVVRPAPLGAGSELEQSDVFRVRPIETVSIPATAYLPEGADDAAVDAAAVAVGLDQFVAATFDPSPMISGAAVELFGQLAQREVEGREVWVVQRYRIMCCAADALLLFVVLDVVGVGPDRVEGDWVEVTGRWVDGSRRPPEFDVASITVADSPANPYLN